MHTAPRHQPTRRPESPLPRFGQAHLLLSAAAILTLLVCILVGGRFWSIGIPGEWTWAYFDEPASWLNALVPAVFGALFILLISVCLCRDIHRKLDEIVTVILALSLAAAIIHSVAAAGPLGKLQPLPVTTAPGVGGYYAEAVHVRDMGGYLAAYPETIASLKVDDRVRGHIADHPVGPILFHWLINRSLERFPSLADLFLPGDADDPALRRRAQFSINLRDPERYAGDPPDPNRKLHLAEKQAKLSRGAFAGIWAAAFLLRSAYVLALIPLYLLARERYDRRVALAAVALAALIPSLHLFSPYPDQALIFFAAWAVYAWHRALKTSLIRWAVLAALAIFLGLLWSLSFTLIVAFLGLATLIMAWKRLLAERRLPWRAWTRLAVAGGAAFLALSLLPMILFDYDTWSVWRICLSQHATFADIFKRTYWPWLLFNPVEFVVFTGVPTALLLLAALVAQWRDWRPRWKDTALPPLPWALIGVLAIVNLSGKCLGEGARLWMFLMPFAALAAAPALVGCDRRRGWPAACLLGLATIQVIVFQLVVNVFTI